MKKNIIKCIKQTTILILLSIFANCTNSTLFFKTTIEGYLKNVSTDDGVNGAVIEIYNNSLYTNCLLSTVSKNQNNSDGYFSFNTVPWTEDKPDFGDEIDIKTFYLRITHTNYQYEYTEIDVVSGSVNTVPDIMLTKVRFKGNIAGQIVNDQDGTGLNNAEAYVYNYNETNKANYIDLDLTDENGNFSFEDIGFNYTNTDSPHAKFYIMATFNGNTNYVTNVLVYEDKTTTLDPIEFPPEHYYGNISGSVEYENNNNGIQNVDVYLYDSNKVNYIDHLLTDDTGNIDFNNIEFNYTGTNTPFGIFKLKALYGTNIQWVSNIQIYASQTTTLDDPITFAPDSYSATISGKIVENTTNREPIPGITVELYSDTKAYNSSAPVTNLSELYSNDISDANGNYSFSIEWKIPSGGTLSDYYISTNDKRTKLLIKLSYDTNSDGIMDRSSTKIIYSDTDNAITTLKLNL